MRTARAYSLVELLVVVAIVAILVSLLLPALGQVRGQARGVVCAARLAQLGHAFHMYATDYNGRAMPLAYSSKAVIGDGPPIYWWGTNDAHGVDHTKGFVWPYLQSELKRGGVYECPSQPWGTYDPQSAAEDITSTYGYNGYYLSPPHTPGWSLWIGSRPWRTIESVPEPQSLFVFADTLIDLGHDLPCNNALLDPPEVFAGGSWKHNASPTTAFRHIGQANVVLADGHVAVFSPGAGGLVSKEFGIGSVGPQNDPHYVPDWREW
jgi:prepilin-type N-terminal cleavage/methylation domain-containing protein/prepilin-type processing-associated H-X9-DG protein